MQPIRQRVDALLLRGYYNELTYGSARNSWSTVKSVDFHRHRKACSRPTMQPSKRCVMP